MPKPAYMSKEMLAIARENMKLSPSTAMLCFAPYSSYSLSRRFGPKCHKLWGVLVGKVYARLGIKVPKE